MRVRVTRKSPIMVSNNNGVSKDWFTFDMIDSSGRMAGIAFGDECTRFFSVMEEDGIYEISGSGIVEVKVKEFEEKKYAFLMENSLVPEWKEKEAENLLIFYSVVQAYLNLNILYYETLVKLKTLEKIAKKKANVYCLRKMSRS